jgi:hypothetical protein
VEAVCAGLPFSGTRVFIVAASGTLFILWCFQVRRRALGARVVVTGDGFVRVYPTHGDPHFDALSMNAACHYPLAISIVARQLGCSPSRVSVDPADTRSADVHGGGSAGTDSGTSSIVPPHRMHLKIF